MGRRVIFVARGWALDILVRIEVNRYNNYIKLAILIELGGFIP